MLSFNKIVNKMYKKWWKVIFKKDIFEMIDPEHKEKYQNYVDKTIYRLKAQGIIISIKAGVYIIPNEEDDQLNKIDLIEKYYFILLKKYLSFYVRGEYFISGKKALEIHLKDFWVNKKIFITTRSLNKKIKLWNYEIIFKTVSAKDIYEKKINIYNKLSKFCSKKKIENAEFKISGLECALVETALISGEEGVDVYLLNKTLKKYHNFFNYDTFRSLWKLKFSMSFNRLKELSKPIDGELSELFLEIIKQNGGFFIGETMRAI